MPGSHHPRACAPPPCDWTPPPPFSLLQVVSASTSTFSDKVLVRSYPNASCSSNYETTILGCPDGLTCSVYTSSTSSGCKVLYKQESTSSDDSDSRCRMGGAHFGA